MKLQANELRIGNKLLLTDINEICTITSISNKYIGYTSVSRNGEAIVDCFKPIPLTEEILLKCGFGKSDEHEIGHNANKQFGFYYDYHFKRFRLETNDDDGKNYADVILDIEYLHQLQNLYFALTNEELTITINL